MKAGVKTGNLRHIEGGVRKSLRLLRGCKADEVEQVESIRANLPEFPSLLQLGSYTLRHRELHDDQLLTIVHRHI